MREGKKMAQSKVYRTLSCPYDLAIYSFLAMAELH